MSQRKIQAFSCLDMVKRNQNDILFSWQWNLLTLEKADLKPSTSTTKILYYLLAAKLGWGVGYPQLGGDRHFQNVIKLEVTNKLPWLEKFNAALLIHDYWEWDNNVQI